MEASAPGPRRSSHRLTARPYSNAGSAETSISIYLSIGSTFFAISHSPKQMELVTQLRKFSHPQVDIVGEDADKVPYQQYKVEEIEWSRFRQFGRRVESGLA